tara:strand:- start:640 stop:948 length:309 start_codon:yes stop_codon:yes gene_type:complete
MKDELHANGSVMMQWAGLDVLSPIKVEDVIQKEVDGKYGGKYIQYIYIFSKLDNPTIKVQTKVAQKYHDVINALRLLHPKKPYLNVSVNENNKVIISLANTI